ncbi:unnamed protein product [Linum tenue]|uniref:GDSL esterase/lipase n=1 Tax=Linum tenue TaxID=586396 RepID=A0AAV0PBV5_9ROSI|nr:unnamed protein product [Linum tenue]
MAKKVGLLLVVGSAILGHCSLVAGRVGASGPDFVPLYVFGGSRGDSGNNNYLDTTVKADSPPYGIDSPTRRPTGRFSNYRNIPDFLSVALKLPQPPLPYLSPQLNGERLLYGANLASGGAGILNDTGVQQGNIITIAEQLLAFPQYKDKLAAQVGGREQADRLVNQGLFFFAVGADDFANNYYTRPLSARASQYTVVEFVDLLISELSKHLLRLYELGARRTLVTGTSPFACWPAQLATISGGGGGECVPELENAASLFNSQLNRLARRLNDQLGHVFVVAANAVTLTDQFRNNPGAYGFTETRVACCGQGPYNGLGQCTPASNLCPNRDEYLYWDPTNPSDRYLGFYVEAISSGPTNVVFPMNLNSMLAMEHEA